MIVSLHVATGAAAGALVGSRRRAVPLGLLLHFLGDVMPHRDIPSRRFEIASGVAALLLVAARRGPLDAATLGAAACSARTSSTCCRSRGRAAGALPEPPLGALPPGGRPVGGRAAAGGGRDPRRRRRARRKSAQIRHRRLTRALVHWPG